MVAIQPLGEVDRLVLEEGKRAVADMYLADVVVLPALKLPQSAYYRPNNRYRADILLDFLRNNVDKKYTKVLGLTEKDISATKGKYYDWGIFGYGSVGGRPCVVSTFRLRRGGVSHKLYKERLKKVINHEIGHTFGIGHCPVKGCLMEDGKGTIRTVDSESGALCSECSNKIQEILKQ